MKQPATLLCSTAFCCAVSQVHVLKVDPAVVNSQGSQFTCVGQIVINPHVDLGEWISTPNLPWELADKDHYLIYYQHHQATFTINVQPQAPGPGLQLGHVAQKHGGIANWKVGPWGYTGNQRARYYILLQARPGYSIFGHQTMMSLGSILGTPLSFIADTRTTAQRDAAPRFASDLHISRTGHDYLVSGTVENVEPTDATVEWWDGNTWRALGGMLRQTADDPDTRGYFAGYVPGWVNSVMVRVRSSATATNYGWAAQQRTPYISHGPNGAPKLNGLQPSNKFRVTSAAVAGVRG